MKMLQELHVSSLILAGGDELCGHSRRDRPIAHGFRPAGVVGEDETLVEVDRVQQVEDRPRLDLVLRFLVRMSLHQNDKLGGTLEHTLLRIYSEKKIQETLHLIGWKLLEKATIILSGKGFMHY